MKQKKLLLLGGSRYLLPVIQAAHKLGAYVITCDYLPDNAAHKYSDEYCNISIIDKEAVLEAAKRLSIDGVMSFACDPGVVTAAYVAEKMGLPSCGPYESVRILQQKDEFRRFLADHGFSVPRSVGCSSYGELEKIDLDSFHWPVIVKPVDSAGSKGVSVIRTMREMSRAFEYALSFSKAGRVIVEEFIEKVGCSTDSDSFSVDGKLAFVSYSAQRFDEESANPYAPAAFSWPSTMTPEQERCLTSELQRLLSLLHMGTSIYNVEARVGTDGKVYIMEVSPRGGGNRLAEMVRFATGADLIQASVAAALGEKADIRQCDYDGHWAEVILHSHSSGTFVSVEFSDEIKKYIRELDLWVKIGSKIESFCSASQTIGTLVLKFPDEGTLDHIISNVNSHYNVKVG